MRQMIHLPIRHLLLSIHEWIERLLISMFDILLLERLPTASLLHPWAHLASDY
jgi:hypothetical protein